MTLPPFAEFFEAAHGHPPFPWQVRLAQDVMEDGWPGLLDLPTGVGKTSALDVALWTLAAKPDRMPRRTLLVVDRRIVVDQGADHARSLLAAMMRDNAPKELRLVASRLRALQWNAAELAPPFQVATLRGGMPRDNDWARRPDVPVLGVSTVDQVGSRLLFRGYGLSARAWPMHAGLLGNDTLFLLDEVHLALPFAQTLEAIRTRYMGGDPRVPRRFVVVQMSATPGAQSQSARRFALAAADRDHPVLRRRLEAGKRARLEVVKVRATDSEVEKRHAVAARAVAAAAELQHSGAKVVAIVVNRVDTARIAWRMLAERGPTDAPDCCLLTGRMRPIERDRLVREVLTPRAMAGRDRAAATPFVVVATQCIEAGADLDFDGMVTECASLDALRQRFGRVDRRGELGASNSVILARSDEIDADDDPVYGPALAATWAWLREGATDGRVDFGVLALRPATLPDGTPRAELLAPPSAAPVLLPAHLDALAQTSPPPAVSPDIALWLHGPDRESADVHLVWRAELDVPDATTDELQAAFAAVRPSMLEAVALPVYAARAWLQGASATIADVPMSGATETSAEGQPPRRVVVMRWQGDRVEPLDSDALDSIRPGDTLLLPTAAGGLAQGNFDPEATEAVPDVADVASLRGRGLASLRCHPRAVATWGRADAAPPRVDGEDDVVVAATLAAWASWIAAWPAEVPAAYPGTAAEWFAARDALAAMRRSPQIHCGYLVGTAKVRPSAVPLPVELDDMLTEDDDSSFRAGDVTLAKHSGDVRTVATGFARALGLPSSLLCDLACAAWLHDVGKADPRFQRWLRGGSDVGDPRLLAKSSLPENRPRERDLARRRAGYPPGYRHELLSLAMIQKTPASIAEAEDHELVRHLVASHHGWCRPFPPLVDDPEDESVSFEHGELSLAAGTRHGLAALDSGVADRYWSLVERYGWWGLAWLEAVLRLADHRASEWEEA